MFVYLKYIMKDDMLINTIINCYRIYKIEKTGRRKCKMCDGYYKVLYRYNNVKLCQFCTEENNKN